MDVAQHTIVQGPAARVTHGMRQFRELRVQSNAQLQIPASKALLAVPKQVRTPPPLPTHLLLLFFCLCLVASFWFLCICRVEAVFPFSWPKSWYRSGQELSRPPQIGLTVFYLVWPKP